MSDGKLSIGEVWKPPPTSIWNAMVESGLEYLRRRRTDNPSVIQDIPTDIVQLKNNSGSGVVKGGVLEIGAALITRIEPGGFWFSGEDPSPDGTKEIAIALRETPDDRIDEFKAAGLCFARINITHVQHQYADVSSSETLLQSKWYGRCRIIWTATSSTGEQDCTVRLGEMFRGPIEVIITQSGGIAPGGSGTAKVRWAGADASPTSTITVYHDWMEGASNAGQNKEAIVFWVPDRQKYVIYELQC